MNTCRFCEKTFKRKGYVMKHELFCREMQNSKYVREADMEEYNDIPSTKNIYHIMLMLMKKCYHLEKEVQLLKQQNHRKQIDISIWLNENVKVTNPDENWMHDETIFNNVNDIKVLEKVFENGVKDGICYILEYLLPTNKSRELPIQCFIHKPNILYVKQNETWNELDVKLMKDIIRNIHNFILVLFKKWREDNKMRIDENNMFYNSIYVPRLNQVMKLNCNEKQIMISLYKRLAQVKM